MQCSTITVDNSVCKQLSPVYWASAPNEGSVKYSSCYETVWGIHSSLSAPGIGAGRCTVEGDLEGFASAASRQLGRPFLHGLKTMIYKCCVVRKPCKASENSYRKLEPALRVSVLKLCFSDELFSPFNGSRKQPS